MIEALAPKTVDIDLTHDQLLDLYDQASMLRLVATSKEQKQDWEYVYQSCRNLIKGRMDMTVVVDHKQVQKNIAAIERTLTWIGENDFLLQRSADRFEGVQWALKAVKADKVMSRAKIHNNIKFNRD